MRTKGIAQGHCNCKKAFETLVDIESQCDVMYRGLRSRKLSRTSLMNLLISFQNKVQDVLKVLQ